MVPHGVYTASRTGVFPISIWQGKNSLSIIWEAFSPLLLFGGLVAFPGSCRGSLSELGFGCGRGLSDAETLLQPPSSAGVGWVVCGMGAGFPLVETAARTHPSTHPAVLFPVPVLIFMLASLLIFPSWTITWYLPPGSSFLMVYSTVLFRVFTL